MICGKSRARVWIKKSRSAAAGLVGSKSEKNPPPVAQYSARVGKETGAAYLEYARYSKVVIIPRSQVRAGLNVVGLVP